VAISSKTAYPTIQLGTHNSELENVCSKSHKLISKSSESANRLTKTTLDPASRPENHASSKSTIAAPAIAALKDSRLTPDEGDSAQEEEEFILAEGKTMTDREDPQKATKGIHSDGLSANTPRPPKAASSWGGKDKTPKFPAGSNTGRPEPKSGRAQDSKGPSSPRTSSGSSSAPKGSKRNDMDTPEAQISRLEQSLKLAKEQNDKLEDLIKVEKAKVLDVSKETYAWKKDVVGYQKDLKERDERIKAQRDVIEDRDRSIEGLSSNLAEITEMLSTVDSKLTDELQQKQYWMTKAGELHRDILRMESDHGRKMEGMRHDLDTRNLEKWDQKNAHLISRLRNMQDDFETADTLANQREGEIHDLKSQVLGLKHTIATSTRTEGQITDDTFRDSLGTLGHDLRNWVLNNFRPHKAKIGET
jgi:hypothetical protein